MHRMKSTKVQNPPAHIVPMSPIICRQRLARDWPCLHSVAELHHQLSLLRGLAASVVMFSFGQGWIELHHSKCINMYTPYWMGWFVSDTTSFSSLNTVVSGILLIGKQE